VSRTLRLPAAACVIAACLAAGAAAGPPAPPSPTTPSRPVFGALLDLVYVTVSVHDRSGHAVPDLPASAFTVIDDGVPRPIEVFARAADSGDDERLALDVAVLLDTSGSMSAELPAAQRATLAVLRRIPRLRTRTIISFDTDIRFWDAETPPAALVADMLAARPPNGASAVYAAILQGLEAVSAGRSGRGALILLSDGVDFGSPVGEKEVTAAVEAHNVAVYPVPFVATSFASVPAASTRLPRTFPTVPENRVATAFLDGVARASGGRVLEPGGGRLEAALDGLVEELASQYVIGFSPAANGKRRGHRLSVRLADPRLVARHRERYRPR
jgi:VWFA-related protein